MIVLSTSSLVLLPLIAESTYWPSLNKRPWRSMFRKPLSRGISVPPYHLYLLDFFHGEKGGLRSCIDYRGLNQIMVKYPYPLPLVPSALEQLQSAQIFTKLDLHSAYNLVHIRRGDKWKTVFRTTSGHYKCCIMPYGLSCMPSIFQCPDKQCTQGHAQEVCHSLH